MEKRDAQNEFLASLAKIDSGDHLCLIYETREEQFNTVIPYIRMGLERNERCLYIADDNTVEDVKRIMNENNPTLYEDAMKKGQLLIVTKKEAYLKNGYFDPRSMIELLKKNTDDAIADGYSGLRITGEMTWILGEKIGEKELITYETALNKFFPGSKASAICQYNKTRFKQDVLRDVFNVHPFIIYKSTLIENPLYVTPDEYFQTVEPIA